MTAQKVCSFNRLSTCVRRGAMALALVTGSATGAAAAPIAQTFSFDNSDPSVETFDTTLGTLQSIDITLNTLLEVGNPFIQSVERIDDLCTATVTGASTTVGTAGAPSVMTSSPSRPSESGGCDTFSFNIIETDSMSVDPSLFSSFTSVGPSELLVLISTTVASAIVTAETPTETLAAWHRWGIFGDITYSYTAAPAAATPVPEPTTMVMMTLGLAGLYARRRYQR